MCHLGHIESQAWSPSIHKQEEAPLLPSLRTQSQAFLQLEIAPNIASDNNQYLLDIFNTHLLNNMVKDIDHNPANCSCDATRHSSMQSQTLPLVAKVDGVGISKCLSEENYFAPNLVFKCVFGFPTSTHAFSHSLCPFPYCWVPRVFYKPNYAFSSNISFTLRYEIVVLSKF